MGKRQGDQIVSRERVAEHGEVYTGEREVNAMLDLVREETERTDSRFLEPACGNGNFMVEILRRKLAAVNARYGRNRHEWEERAVCALCSVYGIDILEDNVKEARRRLYALLAEHAEKAAGGVSADLEHTAKFILERNVIWGDALTLKTADGSGRPIVFSEWAFIGNGNVKRRDFTLDALLKNTPIKAPNLFSDLGDEAFIPLPIKEYKNVNFLKLSDNEENQLQPRRAVVHRQP